MTMGIFQVKTLQTETGFRFYRVRLDGRVTTVSLDPILAEQLDYLLGGAKNTRLWISSTACRLEAVLVANKDVSKKHAGLSRLVSREAWRLVLDPDAGHISDLRAFGQSHPLNFQEF